MVCLGRPPYVTGRAVRGASPEKKTSSAAAARNQNLLEPHPLAQAFGPMPSADPQAGSAGERVPATRQGFERAQI